MADNVQITEGSGTAVHADEYTHGTLGSGKTQLVKIVDGVLNAETPLKVAAEDTAHTSGDGGLMPLAVRNDALAALAGTDGDYAPLQVDANGALYVLADLGANNDVALNAGENVVGSVVGQTVVHEFVPTCDTTAVAANDVLADTEVVAACFRANDKPGVLQSLTIVDKDDVGGALKIFLFSANVSLGTENAAISISDANADSIMAVIDVETTDWHDLTGSQVANIRNLSIPIVPVSGTDDMYCAIVAVTGGTYTASGLNIRFGILQD